LHGNPAVNRKLQKITKLYYSKYTQIFTYLFIQQSNRGSSHRSIDQWVAWASKLSGLVLLNKSF